MARAVGWLKPVIAREEQFEPRRLRVDSGERILLAVAGLVLRQPGPAAPR